MLSVGLMRSNITTFASLAKTKKLPINTSSARKPLQRVLQPPGLRPSDRDSGYKCYLTRLPASDCSNFCRRFSQAVAQAKAAQGKVEVTECTRFPVANVVKADPTKLIHQTEQRKPIADCEKRKRRTLTTIGAWSKESLERTQ